MSTTPISTGIAADGALRRWCDHCQMWTSQTAVGAGLAVLRVPTTGRIEEAQMQLHLPMGVPL